MYPIEKAFKELLQSHITFDNEPIYVIPKYPRSDETPCITIQLADETFLKRRYVEIDNIQHIQKRYRCDLWINIWTNTNKQRNSLINQVQHRILQAEANHFTTCEHYQNKYCAMIDGECEALTKNTGRTIKNQCPNLKNYSNFFRRNNIVKKTFCINSITDLDEFDTSEPVLRSIFRLNMEYFKYYSIGGRIFEEIKLDEDFL